MLNMDGAFVLTKHGFVYFSAMEWARAIPDKNKRKLAVSLVGVAYLHETIQHVADFVSDV